MVSTKGEKKLSRCHDSATYEPLDVAQLPNSTFFHITDRTILPSGSASARRWPRQQTILSYADFRFFVALRDHRPLMLQTDRQTSCLQHKHRHANMARRSKNRWERLKPKFHERSFLVTSSLQMLRGNRRHVTRKLETSPRDKLRTSRWEITRKLLSWNLAFSDWDAETAYGRFVSMCNCGFSRPCSPSTHPTLIQASSGHVG